MTNYMGDRSDINATFFSEDEDWGHDETCPDNCEVNHLYGEDPFDEADYS